MAKKKESEGNAIGAALFLFLFFIALIIVLTPIALLVGWLKSFSTYFQNYKKKLKNHFWLNDGQKETFKIVSENLSFAIDKVDEANYLGNIEGLAKNNNGRFSTRSYRGKEIQGTIDKYQNLINEQQPIFEHLKNLPILDWGNYKKSYSRTMGFGIGLVVWGISTLLYVKKNFDNIADGFLDYFSLPFKLLHNLLGNGQHIPSEVWKYQMQIVGISLIAFCVGWLVGVIIVHIRCKKPALVNLKNVDSNY